MRNLLIGAIAIIALVAALAVLGTDRPPDPVRAAGTITQAAIDADIDDDNDGTPDNTATVVGTIDNCIEVQPGAQFFIDVVVVGVPPDPATGTLGDRLAGATYDIDYDPAVVQLGNDTDGDGLYDEDTQAGDGDQDGDGSDGEEDPIGHNIVFYFTSPIDFSKGNGNDPVSWSDFTTDIGQLTGLRSTGGNGVIERLEAEAVAAGATRLDIRNYIGTGNPASPPKFLDDATNEFTIGTVSDAFIAVSPTTCAEAVQLPTPTPTPSPSPSPTPSPTPVPTPTPTPSPTPSPSPTPGPATPTPTPTPTATAAGTPTATPTPTRAFTGGVGAFGTGGPPGEGGSSYTWLIITLIGAAALGATGVVSLVKRTRRSH